MSTSTSSPPAGVPDWPQTRDGHPFDYTDADMITSINQICHGWYAYTFRGRCCATLRRPDLFVTVRTDAALALTGRIAEVNAGRFCDESAAAAKERERICKLAEERGYKPFADLLRSMP